MSSSLIAFERTRSSFEATSYLRRLECQARVEGVEVRIKYNSSGADVLMGLLIRIPSKHRLIVNCACRLDGQTDEILQEAGFLRSLVVVFERVKLDAMEAIFKAVEGYALLPSFLCRISFTILGLALPLVAFIT